jgi:hypothetical protein
MVENCRPKDLASHARRLESSTVTSLTTYTFLDLAAVQLMQYKIVGKVLPAH